MSYKMECWAKILGNCDGHITKEHLFTEALFKGRVTIGGIYAMRNGKCPPWLTKQGIEMSIRKLTSNILCDYHNRQLGKTADKEAIKLQRALVALNKPMQLPGSKILRPPIEKTISGVLFARWLCKTHCNLMVVNGIIPNRSYVQYAFGHTPEQQLYFYTPARVGQKLPIGKGHINYVLYVDCNDPNIRIFKIMLAGLSTFVTTFAIDVKKTADLMNLDASLLNRLRCVDQHTPLGWYKIHFDWNNDPCVELTGRYRID